MWSFLVFILFSSRCISRLTSPISSAWTLDTPYIVLGLCTVISGVGLRGESGPNAPKTSGLKLSYDSRVYMYNVCIVYDLERVQ